MSGCRHGGRDVYEHPDARAYGHSRQYRGAACFTDAPPLPITFAAETADGPRHLSHFECDGVLYAPIVDKGAGDAETGR